MTNDELLSLKKEALKQADALEAAGLHHSRTYTLVHSDLPIVIDQLIRANNELYDIQCRRETSEARGEVVKALLKTKAFPKKWVLEKFPKVKI